MDILHADANPLFALHDNNNDGIVKIRLRSVSPAMAVKHEPADRRREIAVLRERPEQNALESRAAFLKINPIIFRHDLPRCWTSLNMRQSADTERCELPCQEENQAENSNAMTSLYR